MFKRIAMGALSLLIGVAVALVGAELLSTAWLTLRDGKYIPAATLFSGLSNTFTEDATRDGGCRYADSLFPHPYLAFVHHSRPPCGPRNINSIGLFGDEYPFVRRSDRYVVLLTGGSVASQLGQTNPAPAPRYLEEELNARYVSPTGKPWQVLNGGDGAWKQPQQTILFSLYADVVDAVVTLDGFNEQLMIQPDVMARFDTPANNYFEVNPIVARDGFGDVIVSWLAGQAVGWLGHGVLGHSHAAYLAAEALTLVSAKPDVTVARTFWKANFLPEEIRSSPDELVAWQLAQYRKYIRIMDATARAMGVKSMFFLQPVPAVGKVLTEDEKRSTPDTSYGKRYVQIVEDLESLNEGGVAVRSLLDVFADEKGTIYADWCHPYQAPDGESRGYRLIAAGMARHMADTWGLQPRK